MFGVQRKDYAEEYERLKPAINDSSLSRGQVNGKIKETAQAIENREGRNVEIIMRKIVRRPNMQGGCGKWSGLVMGKDGMNFMLSVFFPRLRSA